MNKTRIAGIAPLPLFDQFVMTWRIIAASSLLAACLCMCSNTVQAEWLENGVPVCTATDAQDYQEIIPDGSDGAIIAWRDDRSDILNIYVQRIDENGNACWAQDGVGVYTLNDYAWSPDVISDGAGGAFVAWYDERWGWPSTRIYAQRIDAAGGAMWTANGVSVCTSLDFQGSPRIVSDGAGGAIIVWHDARHGTDNYDIYANRIGPDGGIAWSPDGVAVCTVAGDQMYPEVVSDGSGGAIIVWYHYKPDFYWGEYGLYAQRIDADGGLSWPADGVAICAVEYSIAEEHSVAPDGDGGALIAWIDGRGADWDIYAQRVGNDGGAAWTENGACVCSADDHQFGPQIMTDDSGLPVVAWQDGRSGDYDIYVQKLDADGNAQWAVDGVVVCTAPGEQGNGRIAADGHGGAVIVWHDSRNGQYDIYAQRMDGGASAQWAEDGVAVCSMDGDQQNPQITSDGDGGALITWMDKRGTDWDIYAQRIDRDGNPWAGTAIAVGALRIRAASCTGEGNDAYILSSNVEIGGETGERYFLHLGVQSSVAVDLVAQTVTVLQHGDLTIDAGSTTLPLEALSSIVVEPEAGAVNVQTGRVWTMEGAQTEGYVQGSLTILPNEHSLAASLAHFSHEFFGPDHLDRFSGRIRLDQGPVFAVDGELDVFQDINLLGVAVFRSGLRFALGFEFDLGSGYFRFTTGYNYQVLELEGTDGAIGIGCFSPGMPVWPCGLVEIRSCDPATCDTPFEFVAKTDISIAVKLPLLMERDERGEEFGTGCALFPVVTGARVKLEEGSTIQLKKSGDSYRPCIDGTAQVDIDVLYAIHFTVTEATIHLDWDAGTFVFSACNGIELKPLFDIELTDSEFELDWINHVVSGSARFYPVGDPDVLAIGGSFELHYTDPKSLTGVFTEDLSPIPGFTLFCGNQEFALGEFERGRYGFEVSSSLLSTSLFEVLAKATLSNDGLYGELLGKITVFDFTFSSTESSFSIAYGCMNLSGYVDIFNMRATSAGFTWCPPDIPLLWFDSMFSLFCPAELHVYDSHGRHVGVVPDGVELGVPGSYYVEDVHEGWKMIHVPEGGLDDTLKVVVDAYDDGEFSLNVAYLDMIHAAGYYAGYVHEPMTAQTRAVLYIVRGGDNRLYIDSDGDGSYEGTELPDTFLTASVDTSCLRISDIGAHQLSDSTLEITWSTNHPATGLVQYGASAGFGMWSPYDGTFGAVHSVVLEALIPGETYYYRILSEDAQKRRAQSVPLVYDLPPESAVLFSSLSARYHGRKVEVTWTTSYERSHTGFNVYRQEKHGSSFRRLNDELVRGVSPYGYTDSLAAPDVTYLYRVGAVDAYGGETLSVPVAVTVPPCGGGGAVLYQNYPNPFNPVTTIRYYVPREERVSLEVFDVTGVLVAVLVDEVQREGMQAFAWDGRDMGRREVCSGIYLYRLRIGKEVLSRKLVVVK